MQRNLKTVSASGGCVGQRRAAPRAAARGPRLAPVVCVLFGCGVMPPPSTPRDLGPSATPTASQPEPVRASPRDTASAAAPEVAWLSPGHVGAAVRARQGDFQACHVLGDLESRGEDGAVTVGWLVRPDGSVNDVQLGRSTFESPRINACVLGVARQITFPRSAAPTNVSWTVRLRVAPSAAMASAATRP